MGGRARGARSKHPKSIWQAIEQQGGKDPIAVMSEYVSSTVVDPALRLQAAGMLASYQYGKRPAYRYIEDVVGMKAPQTLEEARQYLARISVLVAEGKLDVDGGLAIQSLLQSYIDAVVGSEMERRLQVLEELAREQAACGGFGASVTVVHGGLPTMPGCENLIMPTAAPTIEHKPTKSNPWGDVPDAGAAVDVTPKRRGRPRKPPP
jgi:hypothetical protein